MATIIIKRKSSFAGSAQNHDVYLLNTFVGNLKSGGVLVVPVEVGTHVLSFNSTMKMLGKSTTFTVVINEPDEIVELKTGFTFSGEYEVKYADDKPHIPTYNTVNTHQGNNTPHSPTPSTSPTVSTGILCHRCGSHDVMPFSEVSTKGKDFDAGDACCGYLLCGPIGLLCGATGKGKQTITTTYWICRGCGNKFQV